MPFLENVTRGRNVPRERLQTWRTTTSCFGGVSPINAQNRALIAALEDRARRPRRSTCRSISATATGIRCSRTRCGRCATTESSARSRSSPPLHLVFELPAIPRELFEAQQAVGRRRTRGAEDAHVLQPSGLDRGERRPCARCDAGDPASDGGVHLAFTAHSIPVAMAQAAPTRRSCGRRTARGRSRRRRRHGARLPVPERAAAGAVARARHLDHLRGRRATRRRGRRLSPIGFVSDHLEVLFDLDVEAREPAEDSA